MANREVVICAPVRTAIGTYDGTLKDMPATELGAAVDPRDLQRAELSPAATSARSSWATSSRPATR